MFISHLVRVLVLVTSALCAVVAQSADFLGLGYPPGTGDSVATGVSADGAVVVGYGFDCDRRGCYSVGKAFRWSAAAGTLDLGYLPGGTVSNANGISADGAVVVGWSSSNIGDQAFRWTEAGGMVGLGFLPSGTWSEANGVSADGKVIVGRSGTQAFRWTEAGGMVGLGYLPGVTSSWATGVSADGAVVVGTNRYVNVTTEVEAFEAFRWTEAGGMVGLGFLPSGTWSEAHGVSADGAVVVGRGDRDSHYQAFRWTEAGGMVGLGYLPGETISGANGISADGAVIVGASGLQAFRWTQVGGMESVAELLLSSGIDLTGWRLVSAADANEDGSVIVGGSENSPEPGEVIGEAWMAELDDVPPLNTNPIDITGNIKTANDVNICALVLASGRFTFSCNPPGEFSLIDIPRDHIGIVKRQIYADGFFPKIDMLMEDSDEVIVMSPSGVCPSYNTPYDPGFFPDTAGNKVNISGTVLLQETQTPVCAMVLANGQYMFSCDGFGSYALNIPLDGNGQFRLQVYADGFAPTIQVFDEFSATNDVRMARAVQCQ